MRWSKRRILRGAFLVAAGCMLAARTAAAEPLSSPLTVEQFHQARELTRPLAAENPWEKVHWQSTLWQAHERAVREGKPIVVLTTGGEPLGIC